MCVRNCEGEKAKMHSSCNGWTCGTRVNTTPLSTTQRACYCDWQARDAAPTTMNLQHSTAVQRHATPRCSLTLVASAKPYAVCRVNTVVREKTSSNLPFFMLYVSKVPPTATYKKQHDDTTTNCDPRAHAPPPCNTMMIVICE